MKTNRGYIVAMHNLTNKIVTISLEMWDLIENIDDYKPLYRADDKKDAENYVKEISSNIQKEPTMVNKQEFIDKAKEWLENNMRVKTTSYTDVWDDSEVDQVVSNFYTIEEMIDSFCKAMNNIWND
jgi:hypothetical protein